jgi:hypothetical protein
MSGKTPTPVELKILPLDKPYGTRLSPKKSQKAEEISGPVQGHGDTKPQNMNDLIKLAKEAHAKLQSRVRATKATEEYKDEVIDMLDTLICGMIEEHGRKFKSEPSNTNMNTKEKHTDARLESIERTLKQIQTSIVAPESYAEIVAKGLQNLQPQASSTTVLQPLQRNTNQQQKQKLQNDRKQYELTLKTHKASTETKSEIEKMSAKELTERCQHAVNNTKINGEKPTIIGVNKLAQDGIRVQCKTVDEVQQLKNVNWNLAFEGVTPHKPRYGIVIHGVPTGEVNSILADKETATKELEESNNMPIVDITLLRRKHGTTDKPTQSITLITYDANAADHCIKRGYFINCSKHRAERYAQHLQITQCYKCHEYGHRAANCKNIQRCGKCGEEGHATEDCDPSTRLKCIHCKKEHAAWHYDCSTRQAESQRLNEIKRMLPPFFTTQ